MPSYGQSHFATPKSRQAFQPLRLHPSALLENGSVFPTPATNFMRFEWVCLMVGFRQWFSYVLGCPTTFLSALRERDARKMKRTNSKQTHRTHDLPLTVDVSNYTLQTSTQQPTIASARPCPCANGVPSSRTKNRTRSSI